MPDPSLDPFQASSMTSCVHCGTVMKKNSEPLPFCCSGCRFVYQLLKERGLSQYYDLKKLSGALRPATPASAAPEAGSGAYSYLESEDFKSLYELQVEGLRRMQFYLEGIHCVACVWLIEKLPDFVPHLSRVRLDLGRGVATVDAQPNASFAAVAEEFQRLGYRPHPIREGEDEIHRAKEDRTFLIRTGVAAMVMGNIMLLAISLYGGADGQWGQFFRWMSFVLYLPVVFYSAVPFYQTAWSAIQLRSVSIDIPIVLGIGVGSVMSVVNLIRGTLLGDVSEAHAPIYFDSLSALVFLLLASRYWLRRSQNSALNASHLLQFLSPSVVRRVLFDGSTEEISLDRLGIEDLVEVRVGETIPADGVIEKGQSHLSCALLTGESRWTPVQQGDKVFAGTLNEQRTLLIRVKVTGVSTRLGQILKASTEGAARRAPIVAWTDRLAHYFVWGTLFLGAIAAYLGMQEAGVWGALNRALAVVIVSCPCALALATPLTLTLALGKAARLGILIKSAEAIERLVRVNKVYLDKTGTLTEGRYEVQKVKWMEEDSASRPANRREIGKLILALEKRSIHPVARALVRYFGETEEGTSEGPSEWYEPTEITEILGRGIRAQVNGVIYRLEAITEDQRVNGFSKMTTQVGLWKGEQLVVAIELGDPIRKDSRAAIAALQAQGIQTAMLTGDRLSVAQFVGEEVGIAREQIYAEISPEGKSREIRGQLHAAMVGDGANDAIALSEAHVGIAVQGGVEVSLRVADVYLHRSGVSPLVDLFELSQSTFAVIRRNLAFSVIYNIVGVTAAMLGVVGPLFAAVLMPMSAATVFASALWGRKEKRKSLLVQAVQPPVLQPVLQPVLKEEQRA